MTLKDLLLGIGCVIGYTVIVVGIIMAILLIIESVGYIFK